jgi:hypothetical protein
VVSIVRKGERATAGLALLGCALVDGWLVVLLLGATGGLALRTATGLTLGAKLGMSEGTKLGASEGTEDAAPFGGALEGGAVGAHLAEIVMAKPKD